MKHLLLLLTIALTSCGTLYGGHISECQAHKPPQGQPTRAIRPVVFTSDIVFGLIVFSPLTLGVDFLDGAIYKPCEYQSIKTSTGRDSVKMVNTPAKGTTAFLDYKYGFKGARFETPIDSFKDMAPLVDDTISKNGEKVYTRTTEDYKLGNYELKSVDYFFVDGKLATIMIRTKGYSNSRGILSILKDMFGAGYQHNEYLEEYLWDGIKTDCMYDENSITNDAVVWIDCKKLRRVKDLNDRKNIQKAEKGW